MQEKQSRLKLVVKTSKEVFSLFYEDNGPHLSASLSYYTAFSIAPLLLLAVSLGGLIFGREAAQGKIVDQFGSLMGPESAKVLQSMIEAADKPTAGILATLLSVVILLLGASGVMNELKEGLNKMWKVHGKSGFSAFMNDKLLSIGMVLVIGFLLLVSLILSAALAAVGGVMGKVLLIPESVLQGLNFTISFFVILFLFATIFKALPNAEIKWHDVWIGAAITSFLFSLGKFLIGIYIGKGAIGSSYGTAGSVLVLLLWIYYSAQILYLGAEFTKVYANTFGSGVKQSDASLAKKLAH